MSRLARKPFDSATEPLHLRLSVARDKAGWTREAIAQRLKVSVDAINAIEHGLWRHFPNNTVACGLVRNYAQAVGLDGDAISSELRTQLENPRGFVPRPAPSQAQTAAGLHSRRPNLRPAQSVAVLGAGGAVLGAAVQRTVWGIEGKGNWRRGAFATRRANRTPAPHQGHRIISLALVLLFLAVFADFSLPREENLAISQLVPEAPPPPKASPRNFTPTAFTTTSFSEDNFSLFGADEAAEFAPASTPPLLTAPTATPPASGQFHLVALEDGVVRLVTRRHGTLLVGTLHRGERILLNEADIPRLDTDNPRAFVLEFAEDEPLPLGRALGVGDAPPQAGRVWRGVPLLRSSLRASP